jgi:hypothetical protein
MSVLNDNLTDFDPEIADAIALELERQRVTLALGVRALADKHPLYPELS